ncbi:unnamed protein product [Mesocestoides corti]|uniref:Integrase_H2C2 domain-containing protein n=1 Tax=Mesocestoides corti TaxID=53468 RepID=A0A0R3UCA9_MESCO|nr:unnamed protein product [Mesocestoides corti]
MMFGERVLVPKSPGLRILRQFKTGHPGISCVKSITRCYAHQPKMDQQIADLVKSYRQFQQATKTMARNMD